MDFPASVAIKDLDAEHPEYALFKDAWRKLSLLYAGGSVLKRNASEVLTRRVKEHSDVYASRQDAFNYTNLLGNIAGWYVSSMFAREPDVLASKAGVDDPKAAQDAVPAEASAWIAGWTLDCDRAGGAFADKFRAVLSHQIVYGASWLLIDDAMKLSRYNPSKPDDDGSVLYWPMPPKTETVRIQVGWRKATGCATTSGNFTVTVGADGRGERAH